MFKKERQKLNYRFHDPNPPGIFAEQVVKVFVEVNKPKAEEAIRKAMQESRPSVRDELRVLKTEAAVQEAYNERETNREM